MENTMQCFLPIWTKLLGIWKSKDMSGQMKTSGGKNKMFIYGTLKKGQPNHIHFQDSSLGNARYLCQATSEVAYPLIIATKFNLPFLLFAPGYGHKIEGEIFEVDDKLLEWMDEFEGHPTVYERCKVKVFAEGSIDVSDTNTNSATSEIVECWTYFLKKFPPALLGIKSYADYQAFGDHGRHYNPDEDELGPANIYEALQEECQSQQ